MKKSLISQFLDEKANILTEELVRDTAKNILKEASTQPYLSQPGETDSHNRMIDFIKRNFKIYDANGKETNETLDTIGLYKGLHEEVLDEGKKSAKKAWKRWNKFVKKQDEKKETLEETHIGFDKLKNKLAHQGADNPAALAAYIGRKKYGKEKFQNAAKAGKELHEIKTNKAGISKAINKLDKSDSLFVDKD